MPWGHLDAELDAAAGTVSVVVGPVDPTRPPDYTRLPDRTHYAASTMKVAVLAAVYRAALDLDAPVPVVNDFVSATGPRYALSRDYDDEDQVWKHLGGEVPARRLARRMIVRSSNLATNLLIARVGLPAVAEVWRLAGATNSVTARGIQDDAARDAGLDNLVTAADLARLLGSIAGGSIAGADACAEMLELLAAQEDRRDLAAGLPDGVRIAHKNGWVPGVRHSAGVVYPADAPPYVIAVCTSTGSGDEAACRLIARVSALAWAARSHPRRTDAATR